ARAVQDEPAADQPLLENVLFVGEDGGDAGAHRALAPPQLTRAADDRRVTDQDAFHVRDGVPLPGAETAQRDAQLPGAISLLRPRGRGGLRGILHPSRTTRPAGRRLAPQTPVCLPLENLLSDALRYPLSRRGSAGGQAAGLSARRSCAGER